MDRNVTMEMGSAAQKMKDGAVEMKNAVVNTSADTLESVGKETETYIRSNPYQSVLIAFAVGAVAGLFLTRR